MHKMCDTRMFGVKEGEGEEGRMTRRGLTVSVLYVFHPHHPQENENLMFLCLR